MKSRTPHKTLGCLWQLQKQLEVYIAPVEGWRMTPVGFEPTPLRNGALSHCLTMKSRTPHKTLGCLWQLQKQLEVYIAPVEGWRMTPVGFEPTPLRNGALSHRLRPLGQSVLVYNLISCTQQNSAQLGSQLGLQDLDNWHWGLIFEVCSVMP